MSSPFSVCMSRPTSLVETGALLLFNAVVPLRYGARVPPAGQTAVLMDKRSSLTADRWMLIEDNREIDGGTGCIRGRRNEDHGAVKFILCYEMACV